MVKTKPIPVRLTQEFYDLVIEYAMLMDISNSEALREMVKEGLFRKSYLGLLKRWEDKIKNRNPMNFMTKCDKCSNTDNLKIYHVDGNVRNFESTNLSILCEVCIKKLNRFIRKYSPKEKFASWFFYE